MSMTDPIADLLTRIRNAQLARKTEVSVSSSKLKTALVKVLKEEGYVAGFQVTSDGAKQTLSIELKYFDGRPVIDRLERVSRRACASTAARPSCRRSRAVWVPPSSPRPRA